MVSIFVSVAAYRDPELVPTVLDCLAKAHDPDSLDIVVCWQHLGDEDISAISDDPRVRVLDFDARLSRGACWARAEIMRHYRDSDWFLQVDSHTRFVQDWDVRLVEAARATGAAKPVVSGYPPTYEPLQEFTGAGEPTMITLDRWTSDGLPVQGQVVIPGHQQLTVPRRARFVAGGFLFGPGTLVREVPYDPDLYFHGEEITFAVRAFTWGYDLFHPVEVYAWHYYIRTDHPRHWTDHGDTPGGISWFARDKASRRRVNVMLRYPSVGRYAMGRVRTVADYEQYAGISFRNQSGTDDAVANTEPAEPPVRAELSVISTG